MCGIGGIVRMGKQAIEAEQLKALLLGLEKRGRDAAGVALMQEDGEISVQKDNTPASRFSNTLKYDEFLEKTLSEKTQIALVHTRLATCGVPEHIPNNHPLFAGTTCIVHNGHVSNYQEMFKETGLKPECETDSDIIRAIADRDGLTRKTIRALGKLSGTVATAIIDKREPGKLLLARSGNPCEVGITDSYIYFASILEPIHIANNHWGEQWGMVARRSETLRRVVYPSDTAWLIDANSGGLQWHQEYKTAPYIWHEYGKHSRSKWWESDSWEEYVKTDTSGTVPKARPSIEYRCPHCRKITFVPEHLMGIADQPQKILCGHCERTLGRKAEKIVGRSCFLPKSSEVQD